MPLSIVLYSLEDDILKREGRYVEGPDLDEMAAFVVTGIRNSTSLNSFNIAFPKAFPLLGVSLFKWAMNMMKLCISEMLDVGSI